MNLYALYIYMLLLRCDYAFISLKNTKNMTQTHLVFNFNSGIIHCLKKDTIKPYKPVLEGSPI